jgi:hypothetical protein
MQWGRTDVVGTGGNKPLVYPVIAEITLLCDRFILVKLNGTVWACFDADLTSGAQVILHDYNAVFSFADGFFGTGLGTRGIIAMPTHVDMKNKIQFAVNPTGTLFLNTN